MNTDERLVGEFLSTLGGSPERFTRKEMVRWSPSPGSKSKTPDFKVRTDPGQLFYCEVKSLERTPDDRFIPFNRIQTQIHKAVSQFDAVNRTRLVPNVLCWVNHEWRTRPDDLILVNTGCQIMSDGEVLREWGHLSEGRIRDERRRIDLHVWLSLDTDPWLLYIRDPSRPEHFASLRRFFSAFRATELGWR